MNAFWEVGKRYKFKVIDELKVLSLYTGTVILQDDERLKITDLYGKEVTIIKKDIKKTTEIDHEN